MKKTGLSLLSMTLIMMITVTNLAGEYHSAARVYAAEDMYDGEDNTDSDTQDRDDTAPEDDVLPTGGVPLTPDQTMTTMQTQEPAPVLQEKVTSATTHTVTFDANGDVTVPTLNGGVPPLTGNGENNNDPGPATYPVTLVREPSTGGSFSATTSGTLVAYPITLRFDAQNQGYDAIEPRVVTLMNNTGREITVKALSVVAYYDVIIDSLPLKLSSGQGITLAVKPKIDLPAGDYDETLTITWNDGADQTRPIPLRFSVRAMPPYTITLKPNGGTLAEGVASTATTDSQGRILDTLPTPNHANQWMKFLGWYTGLDEKVETGSNGTVFTGDASIYARWQDNTPVIVPYTIILDAGTNGGSVNGEQTATLQTDGFGHLLQLPTPDHPTQASSNFLGWFTEPNGGTRVTSGINGTQFSGDDRIYARWQVNTPVPGVYKITFDANGGKVGGKATDTVTTMPDGRLNNMSLLLITTHDNPNMQFQGWFTEPNGGTQVTIGNTVFTGNTTIYAHWQDNTSAPVTSNLYAVHRGTSEHGSIVITDAENNTISAQKKDNLVNVQAYPDSGWIVSRVEAVGNGNTITAARNAIGTDLFTFTMPGHDVTVNAYYIRQGSTANEGYDLIFDTTAPGCEVLREQNNRTKAPAGDWVTVYAFPGEGWLPDTLTITDTTNNQSVAIGSTQQIFGGGTAYTFQMPSGNVSVVPTFKVYTAGGFHRVTCTAGEGGSIQVSGRFGTAAADNGSCSIVAKQGDRVKVVITPNAGYAIQTINGPSVSDGSYGAGVMTNHYIVPGNDISITSTFAPSQEHYVTITNSDHGSVFIYGNSFKAGTTVNLRITPDNDYYIKSVTTVTESGTTVQMGGWNWFIMPPENVTVTVVFAQSTGTISGQDVESVTLPAALVNTYYEADLRVLGNADGATSWDIYKNTLPDGMRLNHGFLYGTPTAAGPYGFAVKASRDSSNFKLISISMTVAEEVFSVTGTASPVTGGSVTVSAQSQYDMTEDGKFAGGKTVIATATPEMGYVFLGWRKNGADAGRDSTIRFDVTEDTVLEAKFGKREDYTYPVVVYSADKSMGFIRIRDGIGYIIASAVRPDGSIRYTATQGETLRIEAVPETGFHFKEWMGFPGMSNPIVDNSISGAYNLTAVFAADALPSQTTYHVDVSVNPTGAGTVRGGGTYNEIETVELTATPDNGYRFVHFASANDPSKAVSQVNPYRFTPTENVTLVAVFEPVSLHYTAGMNSTWKQGDSSPLSFTTNGTYELFSHITVDGKGVAAGNYEVNSGSTIIWLKAAFLRTLSAGTHTIKTFYTNGTGVETHFTITAGGTNPANPTNPSNPSQPSNPGGGGSGGSSGGGIPPAPHQTGDEGQNITDGMDTVATNTSAQGARSETDAQNTNARMAQTGDDMYERLGLHTLVLLAALLLLIANLRKLMEENAMLTRV